MSGVNNYILNLTDHALGAGTNILIEGATTATAWSGVTHNLPTSTRQAINLNRSSAGTNPSYVQFVIGGSAAALALPTGQPWSQFRTAPTWSFRKPPTLAELPR